MKNKRFLIACGGTGGHFYPGFALGKSLQTQGAEVLFVLRQNDPAASVLSRHHLPYRELTLQTGLPRSFNPLRQFRFMRQLVSSFTQARRLLQTFHHDVVLGMGGYVSFPLIFCAHRLKIKTAVHESNTIWGLSNKLCARFADLPLMGLPMRKTFKKAVLTSTPIRPEFAESVNRAEVLRSLGLQPLPTVLVMGGSQGAKSLNEALPGLIKAHAQWQFIHLTGTRWYEAQQQAYTGLKNVKTLAYSEEVYKLVKACDLIICRSGASTLAEVMACRVPAILVPYPHAAANHQYFNALVLQQAGCAQVVLDGPQLSGQLAQSFAQCTPARLSAMRAAYTALALPNPLEATSLITRLLQNL